MTAQDWELGRLFSFVDILAKLVAKSYTGDNNSQDWCSPSRHKAKAVKIILEDQYGYTKIQKGIHHGCLKIHR